MPRDVPMLRGDYGWHPAQPGAAKARNDRSREGLRQAFFRRIERHQRHMICIVEDVPDNVTLPQVALKLTQTIILVVPTHVHWSELGTGKIVHTGPERDARRFTYPE